MGIRRRLLVLILGVAIPLAVVGAYGLLSLWGASRTQLNDSVRQQAQLAAIAFDHWIEAQQQPVTTLAALAAAVKENDQSVKDIEEYLRYVTLTRPQWIDARIVDADGKTIVTRPDGKEPPPQALIDYLLSETRQRGKRRVVTDRTEDEAQPVFAFAAPISSGGAVIVRINGIAVSELFRDIDLSPRTVIAIYDNQSRLLYRRKTGDAPIDSNISASSLLSALGEERNAVIEQESPFDGLRRVYGLARAGQSDNIVVVGIPSENLYAPAREQLIRYTILSLLALFLAIIAALFIENGIVRSIQSLRDAARRLGNGDLNTRAPVAVKGEIGELGAAFNSMVQQIAEREERLKELDNLKSEFVSSVSHELRTPLTTIKTLTHVLQKGMASKEEQLEYLETISTECDRQIDLVVNLLDLSRIESGNFKISLTETDLREFIEECVKHERYTTAGHKLVLDVELEENLPVVKTDKGALRRVLISLLENAIKYTNEGKITVSAYSLKDEMAIAVKDNGCGILQEDLPHIFEKFYRGRPAIQTETNGIKNEVSQTNEAHGVGLGLYLSRTMVERIGGRIVAENHASGTVFTIYLPLLKESIQKELIEEKANVKTVIGS